MTNFKTVSAIAATTLMVLGLAGCSSEPAPSSATVDPSFEEPGNFGLKPLEKRQQAPGFSLKDANGDTVSPKDYAGKVLLINFWATWCTPCKAEMPWFQEFDKKFKDQGFAVLGVSLDEEGWDVVKPYIQERKYTYRMVIGDEQVSDLYGGIASLPTTFIIDREGKIAAIHTGLEEKATYQKEIEDLLGVTNAQSDTTAGEYAFFRAPVVRPE